MACIPWLSHVRTLRHILSMATHHAFRYSFAYATMGHRLPTILGKAIDDVIETLNQESEEDRVKDLVECIERMDELKHDLEEHAKLRPIVDDGEADVALWNKEIAKYFQGELTYPDCVLAIPLDVPGDFRPDMAMLFPVLAVPRSQWLSCSPYAPCCWQAKTL